MRMHSTWYINKDGEQTEIPSGDYYEILEQIKETARQNEEIEKEKKRQERLNTPVRSIDDMKWKYQEYCLSFIDKTIKLNGPMEVENFVRLKYDALHLGFDNIIIGM